MPIFKKQATDSGLYLGMEHCFSSPKILKNRVVPKSRAAACVMACSLLRACLHGQVGSSHMHGHMCVHAASGSARSASPDGVGVARSRRAIQATGSLSCPDIRRTSRARLDSV